MKYLKLLRLDEHYPVIGCILAASLYLHKSGSWIITWSIAAISISIVAFMLNEIVDREDTDKYSWNPIHIGTHTKLDMRIVTALLISFSTIGLVFSYVSGFLWWGIAFWIIGILYSLKPIRLKARFGLDILAQVACAFAIPFLAPVSQFGNIEQGIVLTFVLCCILWSMVLPYQLADIEADQKAQLKNTHTVMGMKKSIIFGFSLVVAGVILYIIFRIFIVASWSAVMLLFSAFVSIKYIQWFYLNNLKKQIRSMQQYTRIVKPLSQLMVPYLLVWMYLSKLLTF